jgi:hypothetical protein
LHPRGSGPVQTVGNDAGPVRRTLPGGGGARADRVGVEPSKRDDAGTGLLHPVAERGDADVAGRQHRALGEGRLHQLHALGVLGEGLPAHDDLVGVEHVAQQRHRFAQDAGTFAEQVAGADGAGLVALPGGAQQCGHRGARSGGGEDPALAGGGQHGLVADGGLQLTGAAEDLRLDR